MGAIPNSYYLNIVLTELILEENFDFHKDTFPRIVGAHILRKSLSDKELFTVPGFGFQLFSQKPGTGKANKCSYQKTFSP